jgi:hypothetical protein
MRDQRYRLVLYGCHVGGGLTRTQLNRTPSASGSRVIVIIGAFLPSSPIILGMFSLTLSKNSANCAT